MPRIREAIRSGWKYSSWSTFSPTETSLIGLPVTAFTDKAAPPRASPSSFVNTTPSKSTRSWNACATATASWPVIESRTSSTLVGFASRRTAASSSISTSSTWRRPAVSTITTSPAVDEFLGDVKIDVGREQREPDLAHRPRDRLVIERAALAEVAQSALKPFGKGVKHDGQCTDGGFASSLLFGSRPPR